MTAIDYARVARDAGLAPIGRRLPLHRYLAAAWRSRQFAWSLAKFRIAAEHGENRLGLAWVVLKPLLMSAVYAAVFGLVLPTGSKPDNFIAYLVVGVLIYEYFFKSFTGGAKAIVGNVGLVRSLSFPRALLPFAVVLQSTFEMIPVVAVMLVVVLAFGAPITWGWLLVPVVIGMMALFNLGVALIAARLTVHFRDVTQVIPFISRIIFYGSGIFYSLDKTLENHPTLLQIAVLNPVHDYIALVRAQVIPTVEASAQWWIIGASASVLTLVVGLIFFWQAEERYGYE